VETTVRSRWVGTKFRELLMIPESPRGANAHFATKGGLTAAPLTAIILRRLLIYVEFEDEDKSLP
jgi:hypothetical protein